MSTSRKTIALENQRQDALGHVFSLAAAWKNFGGYTCPEILKQREFGPPLA